MVEIEPTEHDVSELGPKIKDIDDADELQAMLDLEAEGEDRAPVKTLIQSRIDKLEEDDEEVDPESVDLSELTVADIANLVRDVDDIDVLEDMLEREKAGEGRKTAISQIESRMDSVQGSDDSDEEVVIQSPEEKHPHLDHPTAEKRWVKALENGTYGDMWVYCETQHGELIDVSKQMLGKARELMDKYNDDYDEDERVVAVLIGDEVEDLTEEVIAYGADVVVYHEDDRLERFRHKPYTEIFVDMCRSADNPHAREDRSEDDWRDYQEPRYTIYPATNNGRDLSALAQAELDSGLASDCSDLYIENAMLSNPAKTGKPGEKEEFERILHMPRPDFSGFEYSTILCIDKPDREFHPQGGSVIPGAFEMPDPDHEREGEVVEHEMPLEDDWFRVDVTDHDTLDSGVDLTGYDVIVAMGRGIGDAPTEGI
jgi:electron transfer flavoprotein alpha subunit